MKVVFLTPREFECCVLIASVHKDPKVVRKLCSEMLGITTSEPVAMAVAPADWIPLGRFGTVGD